MVPTKISGLIFYLLFLFSFDVKCQLLIDNPDSLTNSTEIISGKDSIDKKNKQLKHSPDFYSGKEDAKEYYTDNSAFAIAFVTSLLIPPAGFITTIALSTTEPKVRKLDIPNQKLLLNEQYMEGYVQKATRIKAGRAWFGCFTGTAFFGIAYLMLYKI